MTTNYSLAASLGRIFRAPVQHRLNQGTPWAWLVIVLLAALAPCAILLALGWPSGSFHVLEMLWALEASLTLAGVWALVAISLIDQNRPIAARVVPRHARDLRIATTLGAVCTVIATSAIVATATNSEFHAPLLVATFVSMTVAGITAAVRWRVAVWLMCFTPMTLSWITHEPWWPPVAATIASIWHLAPAAMATAVMLGCVALNLTLIQSGGTAHMRNFDVRRERFARMRLRGVGKEAAMVERNGFLEKFRQWRFRAYHAWMRRVIARRDPSTLGRLMITLGPSTHWTTQLVNFGLLTLVASVVIAGMRFTLDPAQAALLPGSLLTGWAFGAIFTFALPALQLPARLHQARREQALLMLLPGVPRGARLSRRLSLRLTAQFGMTWVYGMTVMIVGQAIARRLQTDLAPDFFADLSPLLSAGLLLPVAPALWRHWARMAPPTQSANLWIVALPGLTVLAGFTLLHFGIATRLEIVLAVAAVSLAWCALRWFRMAGESTPFPVGRLHGTRAATARA